jgi:hypothetical protein
MVDAVFYLHHDVGQFGDDGVWFVHGFALSSVGGVNARV